MQMVSKRVRRDFKRSNDAPTPTTAEERAFLAEYDATAYERPSLTVDVVLFTVRDGALSTLFAKRLAHPYRGMFALPGGFVGIREGLDEAAERVLAQKCALKGVFLEQLFTFGAPDRDPRTRVVTVVYVALVDAERFERAAKALAAGGDPARELLIANVRAAASRGKVHHVRKVDVEDAHGKRVAIAFDHEAIVAMALTRLRGKLDYAPIGYPLLPERFTLLDLQRIHESVLGRSLNKDSFRRRMLASGDLAPLGQQQTDVVHRPAELYRFVRRSAV